MYFPGSLLLYKGRESRRFLSCSAVRVALSRNALKKLAAFKSSLRRIHPPKATQGSVWLGQFCAGLSVVSRDTSLRECKLRLASADKQWVFIKLPPKHSLVDLDDGQLTILFSAANISRVPLPDWILDITNHLKGLLANLAVNHHWQALLSATGNQ